jgi:hypothetical protein
MEAASLGGGNAVVRLRAAVVLKLVTCPEEAAGEHVEVDRVSHRHVVVGESGAEDAPLAEVWVQMTA